jgi:hypothetical protein
MPKVVTAAGKRPQMHTSDQVASVQQVIRLSRTLSIQRKRGGEQSAVAATSGGNNNNGGGNNNNVGVASSIGTTATGPVVPSGQTQAQSAMNQYGSRANNPQTVSEILMAQQSLRDLASTSTPPIQSMTKTAELVHQLTQVSSPTAWARLLYRRPNYQI